MNIRLTEMTESLCTAYFQEFKLDPVMFLDLEKYQPYEYSEEKCYAILERYRQLGRVYMAILLDEEPIGEILLKKIDRTKRCATLGIHMKNDRCKNQGYGTQAEILMLKYAFETLGLDVVYADALKQNLRSCHVLEKVGFQEIQRDTDFVYYMCQKETWNAPNL